ncbi:MAG TPA: hypothetical protein VGC99_19525 [Candidatus Tectomicrobia bacterium]
MAIQVAQITGDTVELVFNPAEDSLSVGENLSVIGGHEERGLIVQVVELKAIFGGALLPGRPQYPPEALPSVSPAVSSPLSRSPRRRKTPLPAREIPGLHLAIGKIRKMTDPTWHPWDGWIPVSGVSVHRTTDREMLRQCVRESGNPLWLGKTPTGEPFHIDKANLGPMNLIVGAKGAGTSQLASVMISELIDGGVGSIIFDSAGAYPQLFSGGLPSSMGSKDRPPIVQLVVGETLKLGILDVGLQALCDMLKLFGLPKTVALYFESHVTRRLTSAKGQDETDQPPAFLGIDAFIRLAQDLEAEGQVVVGGAILSCLEAINKTQVFASEPAESRAFWDGYAQIRRGGALLIDVSRLPRRLRPGIVSVLVSVLTEITRQAMAVASNHAPVMFFDDARVLCAHHSIADVLKPARSLGCTSFFVTTVVAGLEDALLHEADNLFLRRMTSDDEVRYLANRALVDVDSLHGLVRRLQAHHGLVIGKATDGYPIIFAVNPRGSVDLAAVESPRGRTATAVRLDPTARAMPRLSSPLQTTAGTDPSLPLFPDDTPAPAVAPAPRADERIPGASPPMPSVAQVTAMWDYLIKRVARRRRILETILAAARPLRVADQKLVLGFPPQHRFQQELVESEEYRSLLEDELRKAFGVHLEVTTEVYPA